ncbi:MAG: hypothetical protein AVDCRST_MAG89-5319, partial [uncultured Gemmatimonadetes bacterium]
AQNASLAHAIAGDAVGPVRRVRSRRALHHQARPLRTRGRTVDGSAAGGCDSGVRRRSAGSVRRSERMGADQRGRRARAIHV